MIIVEVAVDYAVGNLALGVHAVACDILSCTGKCVAIEHTIYGPEHPRHATLHFTIGSVN